MRKKLNKSLILLITMSLLLCSCATSEETQGEKTDNNERETIDINDVHIRDNDLLYTEENKTEVVTMYLTVNTGNSAENTNHTWKEINTYSVADYEEMGVDRYKVEGLLQVGDENGVQAGELGYNQVSPNCTIQIRGQTSSENTQKNYKISIKENKGEWRGQSTIALNKHQTDYMRFRNKLAYDLMSEIDEMMSLRTTFVHLYVKDTTEGGSGQFEDYGLYTQVEQLNKTALKRHGLDKNGQLYKINFFEFFRYENVIKLKDDPTYDLEAFEELLEIKGSDDHQKLITMLEELNDYSVSIDTILEKHFDIENLTYWMAFHILMGNQDTQSRNFYIYSPLNSNKWYFYSWDNDVSLKYTEYTLYGKPVNGGGWEQGVSNYWGNILFQRCLKSENFRQELDKAIEDLRAFLNPEKLTSMIEMYASVVKPYVYSMPDIMNEAHTPSNYDYVKEKMVDEVEMNYQNYKSSFTKPMPFYIGTPIKTSDGYQVEWDNSYDFNQEQITYTFELAKDYLFNEMILKNENVTIPVAELGNLSEGQYFMRVIATNASGQSQTAFDYYVVDSGKEYGIKCFYVDASGNILEDVYNG